MSKIETDLAEIKTDVKHILRFLEDQEIRIRSLENSRMWAKGMVVSLWTTLGFLGWDWIKGLLGITR